MGELDDDLKITDYLYMKDQKLQPATTSTSTRDAGFPHSTTWRYMFDEGGEEPAPAPVPAIANGNGKNNGGLVTSALSGSTQTQSNLTSTMSRSARQRARRAARKAEVRNNTISCNTIGGSGDGNGSSLNTSKQQPQKSHTKNTTAAAPAVTRTRVMDGRGMWTWDDECDEWDRPYNIQEAQDVLAFMDRLNWESQHRVRNSEYSLTPSPPPTPKVAARLAESSVVRKGSLRVGNVTASASAVPVALKKHYVVDPLTRAVAVHTGALPAPRSFTGGFRGAPPGDIRIALPVTINGVVLTALLVTGRAKSCIDRQVATAFGLRVWCDPALRMIDMYRTAKTQHTCNAVEASCNGHSVKAILDVDDLKYYDFHIGADLFHAFGFFITFCK
ncbi:hypothetical protein BGX24_010734 [Mortierella sp. AD032]|nr:hypothetical protein BGX24_010734 [Mortierella sp. AD032]